ncbi:MAG: hypothetical protein HY235_24830 [Acidobacteria bacterium]|nr:hypothetical protein [Acidobacteriota bacterium]
MSFHVLVLMVPVFFGMMGFAVDLGRLYLARGELRTAAEAMAAAAAGRLIGTDASTTDAGDAARRIVETSSGFGNKYDFGGLNIGETTGSLTSEILDPTFYATAAEATGEGDTTGGSGEVGGAQARHVRIELTGETPLIFWRFLSLGQEGRVPVRVRAAGGVSAPVCTACGTEPIAIAPIDNSDTTDFGFTANTKYTLGYICSGPPPPQPLAGTTQRVPFIVLNRSNDQLSVYTDDAQQLFRVGAQGLLPSTTEALACFRINTEEQIWATASQLGCNTNTVQTAVTAFLCGLAARMDNSLVQGCTNIAEVDTLTALYQPDTDLSDLDDYAAYAGNARRILTVAIVDALNPGGTMNVLGFRQFLLQPNPNSAGIAPNDPNGRFIATYIGSVMPLKQGRLGDCGVTAGPGKVVLHR